MRGRVLLSALLLVLLTGSGCRDAVLRVLETAGARRMNANFVAELPDGLHVLVCGAGGPLPDPDRSAPCLAVIAGQQVVLVDVGGSAARNAAGMGLQPGLVERIFLTHFHSDHIDGLGELMTLRWAGGGHKQPLPVAGPTGVGEVVAGFNRAYAQDAVYRTAHHSEEFVPSSGAGAVALPFATPAPGSSPVVHEQGGLRVTAFAVDHEPVEPAVGYRFEYGGRSVVVSGDTSKSDNLRANAEGVDLLVHEALSDVIVGTMQQIATDGGNAQIAKITSDIPSYHATPVEAAEIAEAVGAGHLLYHHVVPPLILPGLEGVFLEGVSKTYSGPVTVGVDGVFISLPSGSEAIEVSER